MTDNPKEAFVDDLTKAEAFKRSMRSRQRAADNGFVGLPITSSHRCRWWIDGWVTGFYIAPMGTSWATTAARRRRIAARARACG
jgi:hypothetical protein